MNRKQFFIVGFLIVTGFYSSISWAVDKGLFNLLPKNATVHTHPVTGETRFITIKNKAPVVIKQGRNLSETIADIYAPAFGLSSPAIELKLHKQTQHADSEKTLRFQQHYKGVPVIGAELVAGVDAADQVKYVSGETAPELSLDVTANITAEEASAIAITAVSKWYSVNSTQLVAGAAELSIFNPALITPGKMPARLVWKLSVSNNKVHELIFVDANTGSIAFNISQVHAALSRATYTANNTENLPGTFICGEADPTCSMGDEDARAAHLYVADTYNFYSSMHGRDGITGIGSTIITSVHYGAIGFGNAAWTGEQMFFGDGFSQADDVVAHEYTHGVTQYTSNLFYYYQSGSINESFSDVWGEFVDQTNGSGSDAVGDRWLLGEDLPGGAIRDMSNPPAFLDPDRMTSPNYFTGYGGNSNVHTNGGINNKAVYLMVDGSGAETGGAFNGQTVEALGITKVATLYYEVQTRFLTSGADYLDLYNALNQACNDLVATATAGFVSSDCTQVQAALTAVEMNQQPVNNYNPEAAICPSGGNTGTVIFSDDIESGISNWTLTHDNSLADNDWILVRGYASSGTLSLYSENISTSSDQYAQISVSLPATSDKFFLHFNHAFELESGAGNYYGGAVVEYSTTNGANWNDAGNLIVDGKNYTGIVSAGSQNPLAGRMAYTGLSNGYVSTRFNLSEFSGSTLLLRWRTGTDNSSASLGWVIDDVSVYSCQAPLVGSFPVANAGADQIVPPGAVVTLNANASTDVDDGTISSFLWEQLAGQNISLSNSTSATPIFTASANTEIVSFRLTVTDLDNNTDSDIVNIIVTNAPVANAGNDTNVTEGSTATLDGSGSFDTDGSIVSYAWAQTAGDAVTLNNANTVAPTFTAPAAGQILGFSLIVTDNSGRSSLLDTVNVTITPAASTVVNSTGGGGCSLNPRATFNPFMLFVLLGLSVIHLWRGRRKSKALL